MDTMKAAAWSSQGTPGSIPTSSGRSGGKNETFLAADRVRFPCANELIEIEHFW